MCYPRVSLWLSIVIQTSFLFLVLCITLKFHPQILFKHLLYVKKMEQSLFEDLDGVAGKAPRFEVKKWGVIPPKRRSVKRMMFDKFVKSVSFFHACCCVASSGAVSISQPKNSDSLETQVLKIVPYGEAKSTRIFPRKDHLWAITRQSDPSSN